MGSPRSGNPSSELELVVMPQQFPGFFAAPFSIDGEPIGTDHWDFEKLSPKWLAICDDVIHNHGPSFDFRWNENLSHIQMKITSASGAALMTLSVYGKLVLSVALVSGISLTADTDLMEMLVASFREVTLVRQVAASSEPFEKMYAIKERPTMIVLPWPDTSISEQDHALVRELAIHMAGAFFARNHKQS